MRQAMKRGVPVATDVRKSSEKEVLGGVPPFVAFAEDGPLAVIGWGDTVEEAVDDLTEKLSA